MKTLLLLALAGALVYLIIKNRSSQDMSGKKVSPKRRAAPTISSEPPGVRSPYRATAIICGEGACEAALELASQPFLDSDNATPMLPLPNCTAAKCNCRYAHNDDRRQEGGDRRLGSSLQSDLYTQNGNDERRTEKRGRRDEDI